MRALARAPAALPELRSVPVHSDARVFRRTLMAEMAADELAEAAAAQLLIAAGEVYANARRHGGGVRDVRVGRDGDQFVREITDQGPGLDDPLAGPYRRAPTARRAAALGGAPDHPSLELQPALGGGLSVQLWVSRLFRARNGRHPRC